MQKTASQFVGGLKIIKEEKQMGIFTSSNLDIDCKANRDGEFLCRGKRGKTEGAVVMKAGKDGLSILGQKGDVGIVYELIKHMENKSRVKSKDDL